MEHFVGLDVSVRETSLCVVDHAGKIVKEAQVPTEPEAIVALLGKGSFTPKRVGLEAGPMSQWLYAGLAAAGLPVICVEAQHMRSAPSAQRNKTDGVDGPYGIVGPRRRPSPCRKEAIPCRSARSAST